LPCPDAAGRAQVLAAEKAGCWSDALALYEQALQNEAPAGDAPLGPGRPPAAGPEAQALPGGCAGAGGAGLTAAQRGHLHCLLQMGHLQGMLAQVDGWAVGSAGAPPGAWPSRRRRLCCRKGVCTWSPTKCAGGRRLSDCT